MPNPKWTRHSTSVGHVAGYHQLIIANSEVTFVTDMTGNRAQTVWLWAGGPMSNYGLDVAEGSARVQGQDGSTAD